MNIHILIKCLAQVNVDARCMLLVIHLVMMNMTSKRLLRNTAKLRRYHGRGDFVSWYFLYYEKKTFRETKDAERAIRKMHKESLHGHSLVVEFARSRGANDGSCYNCNKKGHL